MKKVMLISVLLMTLVAMAPTFAQSTTATWVMMRGKITEYSDDPVAYGWCGAYAKDGEWGKAHAFWIPMIPSPPMGPPSNGFTFSFYMAKLVNGTAVLNPAEGINLTISGLWDVFNVTFGYHGELRNSTIGVIVTEVPGDMKVTNDWTDFTIAIEGIELLSGTVLFYRVKSTPTPIGDVTGPPIEVPPEVPIPDGKIDIWDLVHVAKAYGSTPGIGRFDFSMDFNFDFEIDICDLVTIAVSLGEEY